MIRRPRSLLPHQLPSSQSMILNALGNPVGWTTTNCLDWLITHQQQSPLTWNSGVALNSVSGAKTGQATTLGTSTRFASYGAAQIDTVAMEFQESSASDFGKVLSDTQISWLFFLKVIPGAPANGSLILSSNGAITYYWYITFGPSSGPSEKFKLQVAAPAIVSSLSGDYINTHTEYTWIAATFDGVTRTACLLSEKGDGSGVTYANTLNGTNWRFHLGFATSSSSAQFIAAYKFNKILTHAMCQRMWSGHA
jgi:hypothetical protein